MIPPMTILITAGPTREAIDPVRFLTNKSSGKMGYAIAKTAAQQGHRVILISGPTHLDVPDLVDYVPVESTQEMYDAVEHWHHHQNQMQFHPQPTKVCRLACSMDR